MSYTDFHPIALIMRGLRQPSTSISEDYWYECQSHHSMGLTIGQAWEGTVANLLGMVPLTPPVAAGAVAAHWATPQALISAGRQS